MEVSQLRKLLEAFDAFAQLASGDDRDGALHAFISSLPQNGKETVTAFVARIKKKWVKDSYSPPLSPRLKAQILKLAAALDMAKAKGAKGDIERLLPLFQGVAVDNPNAFVAAIISARDFVPAPTHPKVQKPSSTDQVVDDYVAKLKSITLRPNEFSVALDSLKHNKKISDTRVKKIAKALSGQSSKTRDDNIAHILQYQNKAALSHSSNVALDSVRV